MPAEETPAKDASQQDRSHWQEISEGREEILNVRAEIAKHRTTMPALVDRIGQFLTRPAFFISFLLFHFAWVVVNVPVWQWRPWDPYPFTFLATLASAEAPFIALLVLMFQQRNTRIEELREEIHLQVSLHLEREISMALRLLTELQEKFQIQSQQDRNEVRKMEEYLDPQRLMEELRQDLVQTEGDDGTTSP